MRDFFCHSARRIFLVILEAPLEKVPMKTTPDIFEYSDYLSFLKDRLIVPVGARRGKKSHQQWARVLGYRSARSVGMVLEGERLPSPQMLLQLSMEMKLDDSRKKYFELLVHQEKLKRSGHSTKKIEEEIRKINPLGRSTKILAPNYFRFISNWYHLVIKQLINTKGFQLELPWIRRRLKFQVTEKEISQALENMRLLGLIEVSGNQVKVLNPNTTTTYDIPAESIRSHHRQMMDQASKALDEVPLTLRENASLTFKVNKKDLSRIKEKIRAFSDEMEVTFEDPNSSDVFQLNVQFFPHTSLSEEA